MNVLTLTAVLVSLAIVVALLAGDAAILMISMLISVLGLG